MTNGGKKFDFYFDDFPPSLRLDLIISSPDSSSKETLILKNVLVDTACSLTLIPTKIIKKLRLKYSGDTIQLSGYNEKTSEAVKIYHAKIVIDGVDDVILKIGSISGDNFEPLIGRDLINRWHVFINGPNCTFEIMNNNFN